MSNRPKSQVSRAQSRATEAAEAGTNRVIWIAVAAIVAIAVVVGVVVSLGGDEVSADWAAEVGFAEIVGDPLPPFGEGEDPAVGTAAPTLRATDGRTGDVVDVVAGDGTVKMIGFFAHWCPHCQAEIPRIVDSIAETPLPEGIELVAVSTAIDEGRGNYPPSDWFEREGYTGQVLVDTEAGAAAQGFGLMNFPYWVVVGADGNVVARASGELTEEQFADLVATAADAR